MNKQFSRSLDSLDQVFDFVSLFVAENNIDKKNAYQIKVVVEELFTNMVKYNASNPNNISLDLNRAGDVLRIVFIDHDVEPFDINQSKEYDTTKPLEERTIGKIGIHFVKRMMDNIMYDYKNGLSKITLIKHLKE